MSIVISAFGTQIGGRSSYIIIPTPGETMAPVHAEEVPPPSAADSQIASFLASSISPRYGSGCPRPSGPRKACSSPCAERRQVEIGHGSSETTSPSRPGLSSLGLPMVLSSAASQKKRPWERKWFGNACWSCQGDQASLQFSDRSLRAGVNSSKSVMCRSSLATHPQK
jgi:hypothetical protein